MMQWAGFKWLYNCSQAPPPARRESQPKTWKVCPHSRCRCRMSHATGTELTSLGLCFQIRTNKQRQKVSSQATASINAPWNCLHENFSPLRRGTRGSLARWAWFNRIDLLYWSQIGKQHSCSTEIQKLKTAQKSHSHLYMTTKQESVVPRHE